MPLTDVSCVAVGDPTYVHLTGMELDKPGGLDDGIRG